MGSRHGGLTRCCPQPWPPAPAWARHTGVLVSLEVNTSIQLPCDSLHSRRWKSGCCYPFSFCAFCSSVVWLALSVARPAKDRTFKMLFPQNRSGSVYCFPTKSGPSLIALIIVHGQNRIRRVQKPETAVAKSLPSVATVLYRSQTGKCEKLPNTRVVF